MSFTNTNIDQVTELSMQKDVFHLQKRLIMNVTQKYINLKI